MKMNFKDLVNIELHHYDHKFPFNTDLSIFVSVTLLRHNTAADSLPESQTQKD